MSSFWDCLFSGAILNFRGVFWNSVGFIALAFHVCIFCSVTLKQFMLNCELLTALELPEIEGWIGIVDFEGPIDLSCDQFGKNDLA